MSWFEALGLIGAVKIVVAYYLAKRGLLPDDKRPFNAATSGGGVPVMISPACRPSLGGVVIEVMFLLIALIAIRRNLRARA